MSFGNSLLQIDDEGVLPAVRHTAACYGARAAEAVRHGFLLDSIERSDHEYDKIIKELRRRKHDSANSVSVSSTSVISSSRTSQLSTSMLSRSAAHTPTLKDDHLVALDKLKKQLEVQRSKATVSDKTILDLEERVSELETVTPPTNSNKA